MQAVTEDDGDINPGGNDDKDGVGDKDLEEGGRKDSVDDNDDDDDEDGEGDDDFN